MNSPHGVSDAFSNIYELVNGLNLRDNFFAMLLHLFFIQARVVKSGYVTIKESWLYID